MTDPVDHARAMLAANWNPDILAQYMAKNAADGDDSDEAMSTDDESDDSDVEIEDASFSLESVGDLDVAHPDDIASDDDAFSSDDEFGSDDILEKQRMRRELVLGRPTQALKEMHFKGLHALHYEYMAQLDEADAELLRDHWQTLHQSRAA
ncbi:hypothetical protein MKEN_00793600 [Mycena kentingensis (nom. inval.)]|nr:hypothetical protein MKEN_00793600 [Mycena kentingensis (nom. inval.)]